MKPLRRSQLTLTVLLAAVLTSACTDRSRQPRTAADGPAPIPTKSAVPVRWAEHLERSKYDAFRKLVDTLRAGTTPPNAVEVFEVLLASEPERLARARQWCSQLEGTQRVQAMHMLYAELMLAETDVEVLYECAKFDIETSFTNAAKNPINYGQFFSWGLSRPLQASLIAYEATKQERFLDLVADTYERVLPFRDSELGRTDEVRGKIMPSWGTNKYAGDGRYSAEVTSAGRISYPITRWIQIVRDDPALLAKHGERAERYLTEVRRTMDAYIPEYRVVEGTNQGYLTHMPTQKAEPLNHMALATNCYAILHDLTGEPKYLEIATGVANYLKASMWIDENGCLVWQYWPQPNDRKCRPVEHAWKARVTIEIPLFFEPRGSVFDEADLKLICKTFLTNIYHGKGKWNKHITSDFSDFDLTAREASGQLCMTPYMQLDRYDPRVREVIEELIATRPDLGGWLNRSHAILAYAHRLKRPGFNAQRSAESLYFPQPELR